MDKDIHYWRSRALAGDTKELALLQENTRLRQALLEMWNVPGDSFADDRAWVVFLRAKLRAALNQ